MATANTISVAEALAALNKPGTDSQRGLARMSIAGKIVTVYDLENRETEVRAEALPEYLAKGFTAEAKLEAASAIADKARASKPK